MDSGPLVSIFIPCYNYGRFLGEACESILNQTYQNWECIIVNDGSRDNTEEVACSFVNKHNRFKYLYQENKGQWAARNLALKHAKGKYIQYLDADDMLQPEKLKMQVPLLEENLQIDLVYSDILKFEDREKEKREFILYHQPDEFPKTGKGEDMINALIYNNFFLPGCVIMRKNVFDKLDAPFKQAYGLEDWDIWFRIASVDCEFFHDAREGTRLLTRHHGSNVSFNEKKMLADRLSVRKVILNDFSYAHNHNKLTLKPSFVREAIKSLKQFHFREKAIYHFSYGNVLKGIMATFLNARYSQRPHEAFLEGAHFFKKRVQRKLKVND